MDFRRFSLTVTRSRVIVAFISVGLVALLFFAIAPAPQTAETYAIRRVDARDHIRGKTNGLVTLVVYFDLECVYCKKLHWALPELESAYPELRIVYRHYPMASRPKGLEEAYAAECAATLGGERAFWKYVDRIYELTPSNNGLDLDLLPVVANEVGIERNFSSCLAATSTHERVRADVLDGVVAGVAITPSMIVMGYQTVFLQGYYPSQLRAALDSSDAK